IIFLVSLLAGLSFLGWITIRSVVSDLLITFVVPSPKLSLEDQIQWADIALKYSPRDPLIRWRWGGVYLKAANEKMEESWREAAICEVRAAARVRPDDYRRRRALGRAPGRGGGSAGVRVRVPRASAHAPY